MSEASGQSGKPSKQPTLVVLLILGIGIAVVAFAVGFWPLAIPGLVAAGWVVPGLLRSRSSSG